MIFKQMVKRYKAWFCDWRIVTLVLAVCGLHALQLRDIWQGVILCLIVNIAFPPITVLIDKLLGRHVNKK